MAAPQRGSSGAARGTIQIFAGRMFFLASGYLITIILARNMGPAEYGTYGLIISLLVWLEGFMGLGVAQAAMLTIPGSSNAAQIAQAVRIIICTMALVLFAACWILAPWGAAFFKLEYGATQFRIAVADLPFFGLFLAYQGTLQGYERYGSIAIGLIVYASTKLLGTLLLFFVGFSVEAALVVNVVTTVAALVYFVAAERPSFTIPARAFVYQLMSIALPIAIFDFTFQLVTSAHMWLLKRIGDTPDVVIGYYAAALNVARLPTMIATVLSGIVLASISAALAADDKARAHRYVQSASRFTFVVLAPVCVFGALQAKEIMLLMYSDAYVDSASFFVPLLLGCGMLSLLLTMLNCLIAAKRRYLAAAILVAMLPTLLVLGVALTSTFGPVGAAHSFLATTTAGAIVSVIVVHRYFGNPARLAMLLRVTVATGLVSILGVFLHLPGLGVLLVLAILQCAYWILLVLFKELGKEDLRPFAVWQTGRAR
ncbi:MAG: oligosaccharide flippase family protein [Gammaproteobacteria bacterium]